MDLDPQKSTQIPISDSLSSAAVEHHINSWQDFEEVYQKRFERKQGRWYFRGQGDSRWSLETTMERLLARVNGRTVTSLEPYPQYTDCRVAKTIPERIELLMLRAFQARASNFLRNLPPRDEILEWLALMRHWRLPSRLLDVTTSPYVALFFALSDFLESNPESKQRAVVWGFNHVPLRGMSALAAGFDAHVDMSEKTLFNNKFVGADSTALVAPVHPRAHNARLAAQQGTFLCIGDVNRSFVKNLTDLMAPEKLHAHLVLQKLVVDPETAAEMLGRLARMNIHRASLFPDLDGYARFLEENVLLFGLSMGQHESHLDFESLERLGWLG